LVEALHYKVLGSIFDGVIGFFHQHNPSSCIMALGLWGWLEPLTGIFPGG